MDSIEMLIETAYAAFNKRDIDAVLRCLQPDVKWANGWEGGYVHGHEAVRDYWTRQWQELDPHVTPVAINKKEDGRMEVRVQQHVKDRQGKEVFNGMVAHLYTIKNGLIQQMDIDSA